MMNETGPSANDSAVDSCQNSGPDTPGAAPGKALTPEARRALEEAEARRKAAPPIALPAEIDGREGEEPTRYGDWERKGITVDF